jgi:DNA-binding GntR family transcriptional regulator
MRSATRKTNGSPQDARKRARDVTPVVTDGPSKSREAFEAIEELIISAALEPKSFVSESSLSRTIGLGRTPVREALQRLQADGLIQIVPSRGILITEVDLKQQLLLLEVRRELERLIVSRAARFATVTERGRLQQAADAMEQAAQVSDARAYMRADHQFDLVLDDCSRNPVAAETVRPLRSQSRRFWFHNYATQPASLRAFSRAHHVVMQAVTAGDAKVAAKASDALMDHILKFARATLEAAL